MTKLELKTEILKSRATDHWRTIIEAVHQSPALFLALIDYAYDSDDVLSFRASWIMDKCVEQYPSLLTSPHIETIATKVVSHPNFSVTRASLRLLSRETLPKAALGLLTNQCFDWLVASNTPIAVKVYAMQLLYHVTLLEPDLKNELVLLIEDQLPHGSAAFRSRGKRILKQLEKI